MGMGCCSNRGFTNDNHEDGLVQAALKQNIRGTMVQPLSPLQWVHLTALSLFPVPCHTSYIFNSHFQWFVSELCCLTDCFVADD